MLTRLVLGILTLLAILVASFFLQRVAPGGPFDLERDMPRAAREALIREWGLDRPTSEQLGLYLRGLCRLPPDLKRSMVQPDYTVWEIVGPRLQVSASLGFAALCIALVLGIPLGVLAAVHEGRAVDRFTMLIALTGVAVPAFVLGPLLKWVFALEWGWLPESRWVGPANMVLPAFTLAALPLATAARLVRSEMGAILRGDVVRTARSQGLSERRVVFVHALPGALMPVIPWLGPATASLVTGSVVVERIFDVPGLGTTFIDGAFNRDYTLVMGTVIVYSILLILMNLLTDGLLVLLDPRARSHRS